MATTSPNGLFSSPTAPSWQTTLSNTLNQKPMGTQAVNPATKVTPPVNTLTPAQQATNAQMTKSGLYSFANGTTSNANTIGKAATSATPTQPITATGGSTSTTAPVNPYQTSVTNLTNTTPSTGVNNSVNTNTNIATRTTDPNNPNASYNQNQAQSAQGLLSQFATNQTPAVLAAEQKYNTVANNPYMIGALTNSGMAESVSAGAGQQFAQNYANQLSNANQNVQNALTGQGQQIGSAENMGTQALTGQQNQISAATNAGSTANTAQGNQIGAQYNAGQLTQPSVAGYGQTSFNPATNSFGTAGGSAGVAPTDPFYPTMQQYAQMAANGQISAIPSSVTGNSVLNAQINSMAKQINPNYNPVVSAAQSASTASNVQTQGTAATQAANTGYSGAVQEYQNNNANYTALTGISSQVMGTLGNYANTGVLTDVNAAINTLQGKISNPDYQKFITAIGNAQASYQAILGSSGVTPTKADQDAVNALNPNSSASTITAALNQLSADAHALIIVPSYQKVQNYKQQLGIQ